MNLSRDQMDRRVRSGCWPRSGGEALAGKNHSHVIANADDPLVDLGRLHRRPGDLGVGRAARGRKTPGAAPQCGGRDRMVIPPGSAGTGANPGTTENDWACRECTFRRPTPSWVLDDDAVIDPRGRRWVLDLQLPGRANRANAAIALATAEVFGLPVDRALPRLRGVTSSPVATRRWS